MTQNIVDYEKLIMILWPKMLLCIALKTSSELHKSVPKYLSYMDMHKKTGTCQSPT